MTPEEIDALLASEPEDEELPPAEAAPSWRDEARRINEMFSPTGALDLMGQRTSEAIEGVEPGTLGPISTVAQQIQRIPLSPFGDTKRRVGDVTKGSYLSALAGGNLGGDQLAEQRGSPEDMMKRETFPEGFASRVGDIGRTIAHAWGERNKEDPKAAAYRLLTSDGPGNTRESRMQWASDVLTLEDAGIAFENGSKEAVARGLAERGITRESLGAGSGYRANLALQSPAASAVASGGEMAREFVAGIPVDAVGLAAGALAGDSTAVNRHALGALDALPLAAGRLKGFSQAKSGAAAETAAQAFRQAPGPEAVGMLDDIASTPRAAPPAATGPTPPPLPAPTPPPLPGRQALSIAALEDQALKAGDELLALQQAGDRGSPRASALAKRIGAMNAAIEKLRASAASPQPVDVAASAARAAPEESLLKAEAALMPVDAQSISAGEMAGRFAPVELPDFAQPAPRRALDEIARAEAGRAEPPFRETGGLSSLGPWSDESVTHVPPGAKPFTPPAEFDVAPLRGRPPVAPVSAASEMGGLSSLYDDIPVRAPDPVSLGSPRPVVGLDAPLPVSFGSPRPVPGLDAPRPVSFGSPRPMAGLDAPGPVSFGSPRPVMGLDAPGPVELPMIQTAALAKLEAELRSFPASVWDDYLDVIHPRIGAGPRPASNDVIRLARAMQEMRKAGVNPNIYRPGVEVVQEYVERLVQGADEYAGRMNGGAADMPAPLEPLEKTGGMGPKGAPARSKRLSKTLDTSADLAKLEAELRSFPASVWDDYLDVIHPRIGAGPRPASNDVIRLARAMQEMRKAGVNPNIYRPGVEVVQEYVERLARSAPEPYMPRGEAPNLESWADDEVVKAASVKIPLADVMAAVAPPAPARAAPVVGPGAPVAGPKPALALPSSHAAALREMESVIRAKGKKFDRNLLDKFAQALDNNGIHGGPEHAMIRELDRLGYRDRTGGPNSLTARETARLIIRARNAGDANLYGLEGAYGKLIQMKVDEVRADAIAAWINSYPVVAKDLDALAVAQGNKTTNMWSRVADPQASALRKLFRLTPLLKATLNGEEWVKIPAGWHGRLMLKGSGSRWVKKGDLSRIDQVIGGGSDNLVEMYSSLVKRNTIMRNPARHMDAWIDDSAVHVLDGGLPTDVASAYMKLGGSMRDALDEVLIPEYLKRFGITEYVSEDMIGAGTPIGARMGMLKSIRTGKLNMSDIVNVDEIVRQRASKRPWNQIDPSRAAPYRKKLKGGFGDRIPILDEYDVAVQRDWMARDHANRYAYFRRAAIRKLGVLPTGLSKADAQKLANSAKGVPGLFEAATNEAVLKGFDYAAQPQWAMMMRNIGLGPFTGFTSGSARAFYTMVREHPVQWLVFVNALRTAQEIRRRDPASRRKDSDSLSRTRVAGVEGRVFETTAPGVGLNLGRMIPVDAPGIRGGPVDMLLQAFDAEGNAKWGLVNRGLLAFQVLVSDESRQKFVANNLGEAEQMAALVYFAGKLSGLSHPGLTTLMNVAMHQSTGETFEDTRPNSAMSGTINYERGDIGGAISRSFNNRYDPVRFNLQRPEPVRSDRSQSTRRKD